MFEILKEDGRIKIKFFRLKITFKNPLINQLEDCCCIENLKELKKLKIQFPHPVGIVISKDAKFGKNCIIFQNVTIGIRTSDNIAKAPIIGNNVKIYAGAIIIGDVHIGENFVIGAGSVVLDDIPANVVCAGNPARIIKYQNNPVTS